MDSNARLDLLEGVYRIYEQFIDGFDWVCKPRCTLCCTCNATMTTLEGSLIVRHLAAADDGTWIDRVVAAARQQRYQPLITTNQLADLCSRDAQIPREEIGSDASRCPLLKDELCVVYAARPFGCRAMVSGTSCAMGLEAQIPPIVLSVNTLFLQFIEAVDAGHYFGNLIDILLLMANSLERQAYARGLPMHAPHPLLRNRPVPVWMIPAEDRQRIQPIFKALQATADKIRSNSSVQGHA